MPVNPRTVVQTVKDLEEELLECVIDAGQDYIAKFLADKVPSQDAITVFLKQSGLYDVVSKRWTHIPQVPKEEKDLHDPFLQIFENVISHFAYSECRQVRTEYPAEVYVRNDFGVDWNMPLGPNIWLSGSGANFAYEGAKLHYECCASLCAVRMASKFGHFWGKNKLVIELAMYARRCFWTQGNRNFVYSLAMTEEYAQLFRFDRSGVLRSVRIDIHDNAIDFLRCVLLVSSPDNEILGIDTSVFWEGGERYISTIDAEGASIRYALVKPGPVWSDVEIQSRGTIGWEAVAGDGTLLLIKDAWRSKDLPTEWKMLLEAKGLEGVVQMVSYEEGPTISEMRGYAKFPYRRCNNLSLDRIRSRVTLVAYGKSITEFETREQFLYAFRDAVAGHRNLWNRNILHRDISFNNILLGRKDALPGGRGVLIDLDMTIKLELDREIPRATHTIGTRVCQSVKALENAEEYFCPSHDHLAELESFFYVLCWTCLSYVAPGKEEIPNSLRKWQGPTAREAFSAKCDFQKTISEWKDKVTPYFGDIFRKLVLDLHGVLDVLRRRDEYWDNDELELTVLEDIVDSSKQDYERYLACVDEAIASLEKQNWHVNQEKEKADKEKVHQEKENTDTENENTCKERKNADKEKADKAKENGDTEKEEADQVNGSGDTVQETQGEKSHQPASTAAPSDPPRSVPLAIAQLNVPLPLNYLKRGAEHLEEGEENAKAAKITRKE